jgi:hypothetical protein
MKEASLHPPQRLMRNHSQGTQYIHHEPGFPRWPAIVGSLENFLISRPIFDGYAPRVKPAWKQHYRNYLLQSHFSASFAPMFPVPLQIEIATSMFQIAYIKPFL